MLKIEHLSKNYGDKKAVDDLNLHIAPGEIYGFIGHNGAGKTTTLKSVAGILQFDTWKIYQAKVRMQLILTGLPMLLCIVCIDAVYPLYLSQLLMIFLFAASYVWLMALTGLLLGIKMPVLTWINEIMPIKQGVPVIITLDR